VEDAKTVESIFESKVSQAIDAKKYQVKEALKSVEQMTRDNYQAHITYHKFLLQSAKDHGDIAAATHHQVMIETFEGLLKNFSMSGSYDTV
jgi:hypothetical protein